jgi:imidazolonepropionase-like amidohydrolase
VARGDPAGPGAALAGRPAVLAGRAVSAPAYSGTVAARDGRVVNVGEFDEATVPRDSKVERIDASGRTVMPGMIDAHCHMTYGESRTEEEIDLYTSPEGRTLRAAGVSARAGRM